MQDLLEKKYMNRRSFLTLVTLLVYGASVQGVCSEDEAFIREHAAPEHIVKALVPHVPFLQSIHKSVEQIGLIPTKRKFKHLVWEFKSLHGYLVKWGVERVKGADSMRACIDENNLTLLTVAKKYLYHVPGQGEELTDENYLVISENLGPFVSGKSLCISKEEAEQICILLKKTGYLDFTRGNARRMRRGHKIAFIDTEAASFLSTGHPNNRVTDGSKDYLCFKRIFTNNAFSLEQNFTQEALMYIIDRMYENRPLHPEQYRALCSNIKYFFKRKYRHRKKWDFVAYFKKKFPLQ